MTAPRTGEFPELWHLLRERFRGWTGNLLSLGAREAALEGLMDLAHRRGLTPGQLLAASDGDPAVRQALIERLVIRTTWFMREPDAIQGLARVFARRARTGGGTRVSVWSVACATGEEPYSLGMALLDAGLEPTILATDVSDEAREQGAAGVYPAEKVADLPVRWRQRFLYDPGHGRVEISRELRAAVTFLPCNLALTARPPAGWASFDVVVCRNVLLYFERRQASRILRELAETVRNDGYLLLSAAEHPLAWSVRSLGWERSDDAPWLRRQRDSSVLHRLMPPVAAFNDDKTPLPTRSATAELQARVTEAQAAGRGGNVDLGLALARQATTEFPLEPATHLCLGLLLKGAGRLYEAIAPLRRARFLFGDDSWLAPYSLAVCLEHNGEDREALEAYRQACAILQAGGKSGQLTAEDNEPMLAATALESSKKRIEDLRRRPPTARRHPGDRP
jgi:chemotaxis protein methyltransferase CheR